jgi:hypothetical protein
MNQRKLPPPELQEGSVIRKFRITAATEVALIAKGAA